MFPNDDNFGNINIEKLQLNKKHKTGKASA